MGRLKIIHISKNDIRYFIYFFAYHIAIIFHPLKPEHIFQIPKIGHLDKINQILDIRFGPRLHIGYMVCYV